MNSRLFTGTPFLLLIVVLLTGCTIRNLVEEVSYVVKGYVPRDKLQQAIIEGIDQAPNWEPEKLQNGAVRAHMVYRNKFEITLDYIIAPNGYFSRYVDSKNLNYSSGTMFSSEKRINEAYYRWTEALQRYVGSSVDALVAAELVKEQEKGQTNR